MLLRNVEYFENDFGYEMGGVFIVSNKTVEGVGYYRRCCRKYTSVLCKKVKLFICLCSDMRFRHLLGFIHSIKTGN